MVLMKIWVYTIGEQYAKRVLTGSFSFLNDLFLLSTIDPCACLQEEN